MMVNFDLPLSRLCESKIMSLAEDLTKIAYEYKSYFPLCSPVRNNGDELSIQIETQEGSLLTVVVCERGWSLKGSERYYDTFEALMNTQSPRFRDTFANELFEKLQALVD